MGNSRPVRCKSSTVFAALMRPQTKGKIASKTIVKADSKTQQLPVNYYVKQHHLLLACNIYKARYVIWYTWGEIQSGLFTVGNDTHIKRRKVILSR